MRLILQAACGFVFGGVVSASFADDQISPAIKPILLDAQTLAVTRDHSGFHLTSHDVIGHERSVPSASSQLDLADFEQVSDFTKSPADVSPATLTFLPEELTAQSSKILNRTLNGAKPLFTGAKYKISRSTNGSSDVALVPASVANEASPSLRNVLPASVAKAIKGYIDTYTDFESGVERPAKTQALSQAQLTLMREYSRVALTARNKPALLFQLAGNSAKLQEEAAAIRDATNQEAKSLFGPDDVFEVRSYQAIIQNVQRVAGFFDNPDTLEVVRGAGVFVGPRLVLTSEHCIPVLHPGSSCVCRVVNGLPVKYRYVRPVLRGSSFPPASPTYGDVALIEVAPIDPAVPPLPPLRVASANTAALGNAVYVIAFSKHNNQVPGVYDGAHVLFPNQATDSDLGMILFNAIGRRYQSASVAQAESNLANAGYETTANNVLDAYGYDADTATPDTLYYFRRGLSSPSQVFARHLRFGFDTPTVAGNSGGGVFNKATGELIGIFGSGATDEAGTSPDRSPADWVRHEEAVAWNVAQALLASYHDHSPPPPGAPPLEIDVNYSP